eukprot:2637224-Amphidinium_carterae.1
MEYVILCTATPKSTHVKFWLSDLNAELRHVKSSTSSLTREPEEEHGASPLSVWLLPRCRIGSLYRVWGRSVGHDPCVLSSASSGTK